MGKTYRQGTTLAPETEAAPDHGHENLEPSVDPLNSEDVHQSRLKMDYLINKINYINFQNGTLQVVMAHRRFERTLTAKARPLPCCDAPFEMRMAGT